MNPSRKRQKVSLACQRCRQRKLGCDQQRPCQLCVRAGATCVPRRESISRQPRTTQTAETDDPGESPICLDNENTAVLPELNVLDMSTQMFSRRDQGHDLDYDTSALPGGKKLAGSLISRPTPWRNTIGLPLPPKNVLDTLITEFFDSVDWFMMVFHEGSFRRRYENLIASVQVPAPEDNNFLWLVLLVLSLGAHYSSFTVSLGEDRHTLQQLSERLLVQIEYRFLQIIGSPNVEAVQICVLMGSFHLFNGRPTTGLGILGGGIKVAQVIGLYRESMWRGLSNVARETRRRSWWALEVADKYAAIAFGRPCTIDGSDCNVGLVGDITANIEPSPRQGPLLEYHRWKFRLYRIMGPFLGRRLQSNRLDTVKGIHSQATSWEKQLPSSLRLETYQDDSSEQPRLLQMQALALQLAYDNLQIILHRSVAFGDNGNGINPIGIEAQTRSFSFSRQQLLKSALRTSELHNYRQLLHACRKTHAVMHIGICLFTSGVVLCAIALSEPLSATSQKAKAGIMNILRMHQGSVLNQHLLSVQGVKILEDLVAVVMQSEQRTILGCPSPASVSHPESLMDCKNTAWPPSQNSPVVPNSNWNNNGRNTPHALATQGFLNPLQEVFAHHTQYQNPSSGAPDLTTTDDMGQDLVGLERGLPDLDSSMGFTWDGNVSSLVDSGLADASQLWLWSDNLGY